MTLLKIEVKTVTGKYHPEDMIKIWAPALRSNGDMVVSTAPEIVKLVQGKAQVELLPGPARIQIMCGGTLDNAVRKVTIPDAAEASLRAVLEEGFEWEPEIVTLVMRYRNEAVAAAGRAENVADTFGSLEGVATSVQAAQDAATSATGSASAAAASATAANDSQTSAASSATAAAQSAVDAADSERVAGEHVGAAGAAAAAAALSVDDAAASAAAAASSESAAATSAGEAAASAGVASDAADRAENVAESVHWQDDRLSVMGQLSPPLTGDDGVTPHVGANGNWWVGDADTGVRAQGEKGDPGDGSGDVLWSELNPVLDGKAAVSHDHTAAQISDATTVGRDVLTASSQATARTAIGAGTSNLALGTTSSTAKAGNYQPTAANISDATTVGRNVLTAADTAAARTAIGAGTSSLSLGTTSSTAARGDHTHTPASIGAAPADHTHSQYATTTTVNSVSSRVTALENSQPIIVSSLPSSPLPGRIYVVTE